jgi:competence protein ComEA
MNKILFIAVLLSQVFLSTSALAKSPSDQGSQPVSAESKAVLYVNINTASVAELRALPGIGIKKAQAIVAHRTDRGNFRKKEELTQVKGINLKLLAKIESHIRVK